jgi:erythromycin esterase-like protein
VPDDAQWLLGPRLFRLVGAVYEPTAAREFYQEHALPREYDLVIHLSRVTATRLLPFRYQ